MSGIREILEQIICTPTVNLASSDQLSSAVSDKDIPLSFFFSASNAGKNGLGGFIKGLKIPKLHFRYSSYATAIKKYGFRMESTTNGYSEAGDAPFAFFVPKTAYEDVVLQARITNAPRALVSSDFMASLLLVDFPSPIFSGPRSAHGLYRIIRTVSTELSFVVGDRYISKRKF